ncbi:MAG: SDR family oxidoreductase [Planctomycetota bacterium]
MSDHQSDPLRVFVTGGTKGIGRAVALRFARGGAQVAVAARTSEDLDEVVHAIDAAGGRGDACQANLRDHGSLEAAVFRAVDFFGGATDIVVNAAGLVDLTAFDELDLDTWERHLDVHLTGPFLVVSEALPSLRESERAHVFNIGSDLAAEPIRGSLLLAATKAGVAGLGRGLRADLADDGIRVTTVVPGFVDTPGLGPWKDKLGARALVTPDAVAEAIWDAYASDEAPAELEVR